MKIFILYLIVILPFVSSYADSKKLPIPRFVTIKSSEANIRTGPNLKYPIKWIFKQKGEPVEIIAEFEHWRKIQDVTGEEGWVHESMLKFGRRVIILGEKVQNVYKGADKLSKISFKIEKDVRVDLISCKNNWCQIKVEDKKGWINRENLWGIYPNEDVTNK